MIEVKWPWWRHVLFFIEYDLLDDYKRLPGIIFAVLGAVLAWSIFFTEHPHQPTFSCPEGYMMQADGRFADYNRRCVPGVPPVVR